MHKPVLLGNIPKRIAVHQKHPNRKRIRLLFKQQQKLMIIKKKKRVRKTKVMEKKRVAAVIVGLVVGLVKTLRKARAWRKKRKMAVERKKRAKMSTRVMPVSDYSHHKALEMATMTTRMTCKRSMSNLSKKCFLKMLAPPPLKLANSDTKGLSQVMVWQ